jgi:hypothetical protein
MCAYYLSDIERAALLLAGERDLVAEAWSAFAAGVAAADRPPMPSATKFSIVSAFSGELADWQGRAIASVRASVNRATMH